MPFIETIVIREASEALPRLAQLGTTLERLLQVRDFALQEASTTGPFHCRNAGGTFAYQYGVYALRLTHVDGDEWKIDRAENVEGIVNERLSVRILFSNVDVACSDIASPKPRSAKGAGTERVCAANLFEYLPEFTRPPEEGLATFYLMIDENGAAELTRPVVAGGTFASYVERIWLSKGHDDANPLDGRPSLDDDDAVTEFDPKVARK